MDTYTVLMLLLYSNLNRCTVLPTEHSMILSYSCYCLLYLFKLCVVTTLNIFYSMSSCLFAPLVVDSTSGMPDPLPAAPAICAANLEIFTDSGVKLEYGVKLAVRNDALPLPPATSDDDAGVISPPSPRRAADPTTEQLAVVAAENDAAVVFSLSLFMLRSCITPASGD